MGTRGTERGLRLLHGTHGASRHERLRLRVEGVPVVAPGDRVLTLGVIGVPIYRKLAVSIWHTGMGRWPRHCPGSIGRSIRARARHRCSTDIGGEILLLPDLLRRWRQWGSIDAPGGHRSWSLLLLRSWHARGVLRVPRLQRGRIRLARRCICRLHLLTVWLLHGHRILRVDDRVLRLWSPRLLRAKWAVQMSRIQAVRVVTSDLYVLASLVAVGLVLSRHRARS